MNKDLAKTLTLGTVLAALGFLIAYQFVDPAPPTHLVIATGAENGAYHQFAQKYREQLAREGINLELRPTLGSVENIQLLADGAADVAFVQGGTGHGEPLLSLGSLYYEPLWIFYRGERPLQRLSEFAGLRFAAGLPGSGTRMIMDELLAENGIAPPRITLLPLGGDPALAALVSGEADAAAFVAGSGAEVVQRLIGRSDTRLLSFTRAAAYNRRHHFLSTIDLPEGSMDLARNLPDRRIRLLAPTANLVVSERLHPALVDLLLQAAQHVHGPGGLFEEPQQFPSARFLEYPLHSEAARFFKSGPPFLQRYLPFWAASLIDRLKVMLLPLVALLIPLLKVMPPLYRWRMRSRIYRWYRELEAIDLEMERGDADLGRLAERLDRIEQEVIRVSVPLSFAVELYDLRMHLALVRDQARTEGKKSRMV